MAIIMAIYEYWTMLHDVAIRWFTECPVAYMLHGITCMLAGFILWDVYNYIRVDISIRKTLKKLRELREKYN